jgi:hypothetical protein
MRNETKTWLAAAAVFAAALVPHGALCADATEDTPAVGVERRIVYSEGFENDGKMTVWAHNAGYKVNFAGPTTDHAASGKRSFKIDVTWDEDCRYFYWWAGALVPLYGDPIVHGKLRVERGKAELGHAYAIPEKRVTGNKVVGVNTGSLQNGWTQRRSSAAGAPGETTYLQGVAVYLQPDETRRTIVYVDDLEIEAALPDGYEPGFKTRVAEIETAHNTRIQTELKVSAAMLPARFARMTAEIDGSAAVFPAAASAELRDYYARLTRQRDEVRAQLDKELPELQDNLTRAGANSAKQLLAKLEAIQPTCRSLADYAAAHPASPYIPWIAGPISNNHVLPEKFPVPGIAGTALSVTACAGEYEPVSVSLYAFEDLHDVTANCSDARSGESTFPSSQIDVRIVKCWWQDGVELASGDVRKPTLTPELLLKDPGFVSVDLTEKRNTLKAPKAPRDAVGLQPISIPAETAQQFWITVHVPEDAKASTYVATLTLKPGNAPELVLPLTIRVLPFKLAEPALIYSIYYRGQLAADAAGSIDADPKSAEQYLAEMRNLKAHGISHPTMYQRFDDKALFDRAIEMRRQAGLSIDPLYSLGITMGRGPPMTPEALTAWKEKVRTGLAQVRAHGIKELYVYGLDEADGERLKAERRAFKVTHEAGARLFVACGGIAFTSIGDLLDLAVYAGTPDPGEREKWHQAGHRIFSYNHPQVGMEQPEIYRRNFGLALWKSGYDGTMNYAYQHNFGDFYDDTDGDFRDHVFAYPTVDGVIDTIQWEGFREGVDDVRYLTTLLKAIEQAKAADGKALLAKEAAEWVATMDLDGDLQALRSTIVGWILRLSN